MDVVHHDSRPSTCPKKCNDDYCLQTDKKIHCNAELKPANKDTMISLLQMTSKFTRKKDFPMNFPTEEDVCNVLCTYVKINNVCDAPSHLSLRNLYFLCTLLN